MDVYADICRAIDSYKENAVSLSHQIHQHPELRFKEYFAAGLLSDAARKLGLQVETGVGGLETAFRAEFGNSDGGPTVAILAEYDALPNGHSCGHNLIAGAALSAIAGLKGAKSLPGRIVFLGTPGEEGGGGKIILFDKGAFKGVDAAMMAHPAAREVSALPSLAAQGVHITFLGKAAHAAAAPWNGSSALSAVIQTFNSVDAMRLHLRDGTRIHGIVTDGGQAVNIIPAKAECQFACRWYTSEYVDEIVSRLIRCAEAAALTTGTKTSHKIFLNYQNMISNRAIARHYAQLSEQLGAPPESKENTPAGSTDMGNISHFIPSIHPTFQVCRPADGNPHEDAFVGQADSEHGYAAMIRVAKALAMTAYDLLADPELMKAAKAEFADRQHS